MINAKAIGRKKMEMHQKKTNQLLIELDYFILSDDFNIVFFSYQLPFYKN